MTSTFYITSLHTVTEDLEIDTKAAKQENRSKFYLQDTQQPVQPTLHNYYTPVSKSMSLPSTAREMSKTRKLSTRYPINAKAQQIVTAVHYTKKDYLFKLSVEWSDNTMTSVNRNYVQLFEFQCKILDSFPFEAGQDNSIRIIPYLPGRQLFSKNSKKLAEERLPEIDTYVNEIVHLPDNIRRDPIVVDFFMYPDTTENGTESSMKQKQARSKSTTKSIFYSKQVLGIRNRSHTTNTTNNYEIFNTEDAIALIDLS